MYFIWCIISSTIPKQKTAVKKSQLFSVYILFSVVNLDPFTACTAANDSTLRLSPHTAIRIGTSKSGIIGRSLSDK